jgi:hypothetical protein
MKQTNKKRSWEKSLDKMFSKAPSRSKVTSTIADLLPNKAKK